MKSKKINLIETEPETILEISETEAEELEGGKTGSCCWTATCNTHAKQE